MRSEFLQSRYVLWLVGFDRQIDKKKRNRLKAQCKYISCCKSAFHFHSHFFHTKEFGSSWFFGTQIFAFMQAGIPLSTVAVYCTRIHIKVVRIFQRYAAAQ